MSSARPRSLLSSTSFRLVLLCAVVIVIAFALAGLGAWVVTKSAAQHASRERILLEMEALQDEINDEGINAAVAAIRTRQHMPGALEYRLIAPNGAVLIGDLEIETPVRGWSAIYPPDTGETKGPDLVVFNQPTAGGGSLIVAEDLERTEGVRYAVLRTLLWIGAGALLVSLVIGYLATRSALLRMDRLFSAVERAGAGDFSARVPASSPRNETDVDVLGRQINAMLTQIDTLVGNLRRVSTDIAHDLRTPLTHVRQSLEEIQAAPSLDGAKEAAQSARQKIDELMRVFDATLRLAEIEAGAARARFAPVDLAALIERLADAYRPDIEGAGGSLRVAIEGPRMIEGDADLLTQALANLLDNAIAHAAPSAAIVLRLSAGANGVSIDVEDNGPGVPAADRARVLEPYVRLDRSRSSRGVGLGLSIVNAIARLHGARLMLDDAAPGLRVRMNWSAAAAE